MEKDTENAQLEMLKKVSFYVERRATRAINALTRKIRLDKEVVCAINELLPLCNFPYEEFVLPQSEKASESDDRNLSFYFAKFIKDNEKDGTTECTD